MNLKFSLFFCLLFLIISCETNESVEEEKLPSAEITSYTILDNNLDFVKTQTDIEFSDTQNQFLEEHGVYWYKNSGSKRKINLGTYQSNQFTTDISQGLLKDSIYKTFPFAKFQGNYINGDTVLSKI